MIKTFKSCQLHLEKQIDSNVVNFISKNRLIRMLSTSSRKIDGFECFGRVRNYYEIISRKFQNSQNFQNNAIKDVKQISSNGVIIIFYHVVLSVYFEKQYCSVLRRFAQIMTVSQLTEKLLTEKRTYFHLGRKNSSAINSSIPRTLQTLIRRHSLISRSHIILKIGVLKSFLIPIGKHLCQSLSLIKLRA